MKIAEGLDKSIGVGREFRGSFIEAVNILPESREYWEYRGHWDEVSKKYQSLVSRMPERFKVSPVYFGAEVEVEDVVYHSHVNLGGHAAPPGFNVHTDGSLRNGLEFVTTPLPFPQLLMAFVNLDKYMQAHMSKQPSFSWRTSNHIHLNVRDMSWAELVRLMLLYSIFELQMFKFAGNTRVNSVFCVPLTKTSLNYNIHEMLRTGANRWLSRDGGSWDKYCALGVFRLFDLGTLEFRHFPGGFDVDRLAQWVSLILSLRVAASSMSWDQLLYYIKNLNTLCNYRDLQRLVFGDDLAHELGEPETHVQMLSNGVTFAKKCLVKSGSRMPEPNSCMDTFIQGLAAEQTILHEKYMKEHGEDRYSDSKKPRFTFSDDLVMVVGQAQPIPAAGNWNGNTNLHPGIVQAAPPPQPQADLVWIDDGPGPVAVEDDEDEDEENA